MIIVFTFDKCPSKEPNQKVEPRGPTLFDSLYPFGGIMRDLIEGGVRWPAVARLPGHIPDTKTGVFDR